MYNFLVFYLSFLVCHFIGDYLFQIDYIAETKGNSIYHLIIHCVLYTVPFMLLHVQVPLLAFIFVTHAIVDYLRSSKKAISYALDQVLHYATLLIVAIMMF